MRTTGYLVTVSRSLVKLTEIGTSWGVALQVPKSQLILQSLKINLANRADHDEILRSVAFHMHPHCLQKYQFSASCIKTIEKSHSKTLSERCDS